MAAVVVTLLYCIKAVQATITKSSLGCPKDYIGLVFVTKFPALV